MKRLEMVKFIKETIDRIYTVQNIDSVEPEDLANQLLYAIESYGMEAPKIKSKLVKPKDYRFGAGCSMRCVCEECDPDFLINKWEPEND